MNESGDEDYLLELNNADCIDDENHRAGAITWTRKIVTPQVHAEVELFKMAKGIKLQAQDTGIFSCPLKWWKLHQSSFPFLSLLAMKLLPIPATSAPLERVFSMTGLTIAKDRARLEPDRANQLVFLHDSLPRNLNYMKRKWKRLMVSNDK